MIKLSTQPLSKQAAYVRSILARLKKDKGEPDTSEIIMAWARMVYLSTIDRDIEREYLVGCADFPSMFYYPQTISTEPWYKHPVSIACGEYPLELLPEYLRDFAKKLYYH